MPHWKSAYHTILGLPRPAPDAAADETNPKRSQRECRGLRNHSHGEIKGAAAAAVAGKCHADSVIVRDGIAADLQIEAGKKPRYLMVTGHMRAARRPTKTGFAECAVYVVEANSGKFAAYTVPWLDTMFRSGRVQMGELVLLGVGSVRTAAVRE